jgi:hypothetical protein
MREHVQHVGIVGRKGAQRRVEQLASARLAFDEKDLS